MNKYISIFTIDGVSYNLKDTEARLMLENIATSVTGAMHFIGLSSTLIEDGSDTGSWVVDGVTYVPSGATGNQKNLKSGDAALYNNKEFVWGGSAWREYGDLSSLKALAYKNNATGTITPAGTNASSVVTLSGGASSKLVTTTITGTNGTETVHDTPTLNTTNITGVSGSTITHDTPTLNKSSIGSASNWNAGTMFTATVDQANEIATFTAGTVPSLTITSTQVGTSLTAGTSVTVPIASTSVAVGTSLTPGALKTVAKQGTATTVATGSVSNTASGATVVTSSPTSGTAAGQVFTGTSVDIVVS